jgi:hypothetical protein
MSLLSVFCLMDTDNGYKKAAQELVTRRYNSLYEALGIPQPPDPNAAHYYTEIDIRQVATAAYSQELADWIDQNIHPLDFVFRLADEEEVVLMPGGGFDGPKSSVRASLANLDDADYVAIGKRMKELVDEYYQRWQASSVTLRATEHYPFQIRERFGLAASLWHAREVKTSTTHYPFKYHLPGNSKGNLAKLPGRPPSSLLQKLSWQYQSGPRYNFPRALTLNEKAIFQGSRKSVPALVTFRRDIFSG